MDRILTWADAHPLAAVGFWVLALVAIALWAGLAPTALEVEPAELGTGDLGAGARAYHEVPEGGYRPAGDPGPRRVGGEVDEASGLPRPG